MSYTKTIGSMRVTKHHENIFAQLISVGAVRVDCATGKDAKYIRNRIRNILWLRELNDDYKSAIRDNTTYIWHIQFGRSLSPLVATVAQEFDGTDYVGIKESSDLVTSALSTLKQMVDDGKISQDRYDLAIQAGEKILGR